MPLAEPPTKIYEPKPPDWAKLQSLSQSSAPDRIYAPPGKSAGQSLSDIRNVRSPL